MNRIHFRPEEKRCEMECGNQPIRNKDKFLSSLVIEIINNLNVSYSERRIIDGLLNTSLRGACFQLLEDFLHLELEILSETIAKALGVKPVVNYSHATHAKFYDMIEEYKTSTRK